MIVSYEILVDFNENQLAAAVLERVKAGWQLQGGVSITYAGPDRWAYAQAIVFEFAIHDGPS